MPGQIPRTPFLNGGLAPRANFRPARCPGKLSPVPACVRLEGKLARLALNPDQAASNDATLPLESVEAEKSSNSRARRFSLPPSCRNALRKARIRFSLRAAPGRTSVIATTRPSPAAIASSTKAVSR